MTTAEGKNSMFSLMTRASVPIALFACFFFSPDVSYAADRSTIEDLDLSAGEGEGPGVGAAEEDGGVEDGAEAHGGVEEIDVGDIDLDDIDLDDLDLDDIDEILDDPRYLERIRRLELSGEYLRWVIHNTGY